MSEDCVRTATIIAEEVTDLLVVDRALYNRAVKEVLAKEYEDKVTFINSNPLFSAWPPRYKKQLTMAMYKEEFAYNTTLVKQGDPVDIIYFLIRWKTINKFCKQWIHPFDVTVEPSICNVLFLSSSNYFQLIWLMIIISIYFEFCIRRSNIALTTKEKQELKVSWGRFHDVKSVYRCRKCWLSLIKQSNGLS